MRLQVQDLRFSEQWPMSQRVKKKERCDEAIVEVAQKAKIAGVRAGTEHRYTGVWIVVVDGSAY